MVFVETGTYLGDATAWAANFASQVLTIELSTTYHAKALERFAAQTNIRCLQGDSGELLPTLVEGADDRWVFWLDGHFSFGETAGAAHECPLLAELKALRFCKSAPCVLIDDAKFFLAPPPAPHRATDWPELGQVFSALREIDSDYYIAIVEDVIVAVPRARAKSLQSFLRSENEPRSALRDHVISLGHADRTEKVRLHLGCGQTLLPNYINVDFPSSAHNVMDVHPDFEEDILELDLPEKSVDEIRLHHVFEHFNRVNALGLLIRWHRWLRVGGVLQIETPDFEGSAQVFSSASDPAVRSGVVRHLAGDQAAGWAYHLDHWYEERYRQALAAFGFNVASVHRALWDRPPFLANITVTATKVAERSLQEQLAAADSVLWMSTVHPAEAPTHAVWRKQLRAFFGLSWSDEAFSIPTKSLPASAGLQLADRVKSLLREMADASPGVSISQIQSYNPANRDKWVAAKAQMVAPGSRVLDVGAGTCPYKHLFTHCEYVAQDFQEYQGYKGAEGAYGKIDLVSDILNIPAPSASFDVILCTEVLEHVSDPRGAVAEMSRLLKPGGRMFLTAPLGSGLHQEPFHFYGGYTPHWYRHVSEQNGLDLVEVTKNGGFFALLGQECARVAWTMEKFRGLYRDPEAVGYLFGELLPRYLYQFDAGANFETFTAGYFVEAVKRAK